MSTPFLSAFGTGALVSTVATLTSAAGWELMATERYSSLGVLITKIGPVAVSAIILFRNFVFSNTVNAFPIPSIAGLVVGLACTRLIANIALEALGMSLQTPGSLLRMYSQFFSAGRST